MFFISYPCLLKCSLMSRHLQLLTVVLKKENSRGWMKKAGGREAIEVFWSSLSSDLVSSSGLVWSRAYIKHLECIGGFRHCVKLLRGCMEPATAVTFWRNEVSNREAFSWRVLRVYLLLLRAFVFGGMNLDTEKGGIYFKISFFVKRINMLWCQRVSSSWLSAASSWH